MKSSRYDSRGGRVSLCTGMCTRDSRLASPLLFRITFPSRVRTTCKGKGKQFNEYLATEYLDQENILFLSFFFLEKSISFILLSFLENFFTDTIRKFYLKKEKRKIHCSIILRDQSGEGRREPVSPFTWYAKMRKGGISYKDPTWVRGALSRTGTRTRTSLLGTRRDPKLEKFLSRIYISRFMYFARGKTRSLARNATHMRTHRSGRSGDVWAASSWAIIISQCLSSLADIWRIQYK